MNRMEEARLKTCDYLAAHHGLTHTPPSFAEVTKNIGELHTLLVIAGAVQGVQRSIHPDAKWPDLIVNDECGDLVIWTHSRDPRLLYHIGVEAVAKLLFPHLCHSGE